MVSYQATLEKLEDALEREVKRGGADSPNALKLEYSIANLFLLGRIFDVLAEAAKRMDPTKKVTSRTKNGQSS